jgi:hypothetical protein
LEHDLVGKPVSTFPDHVLGWRIEPAANNRHRLLDLALGLVLTGLWIGEPRSVAMMGNEVYCAIGWIDRKIPMFAETRSLFLA